MKAEDIRKRLRDLGNKGKAKILQRFFKTGPGQYGEGDLFLGIPVPRLRKLCKECGDMALGQVEALLKSAVHEERLLLPIPVKSPCCSGASRHSIPG